LSSRLATVGEMASGIAHEINNPLTSVIGFAQLLLQKDTTEDVKEYAKIIDDGAQRVANIVKRLLTFARQHKPEKVYVDINQIIETTLQLRAYELETSNIKVTRHLDTDLPWTMADASQLQRVFLNIIINAETEMSSAHGKGKLLIKTKATDNTIRISFKDSGPGIAKENLERIFDPFFTSRKGTKGTGLGLSICHAIISEHKGQLYVKSKLGQGATFIVELPLITEEKQLELAELATDESNRVVGAKILVVDDEPLTLQLLS
jgi:signal transduction histidine kinase